MTEIIINLQVEGVHHWPDCPHNDVGFLRDPHRHMFHIRMCRPVEHEDRAIETIRFKRQVIKRLGKQPIDFGRSSCETIARELGEYYRCRRVEVMEDGEIGGAWEADQ